MDNLIVLINEKGQLLEIDPKETSEDSILVPLSGYYEVLNAGYPHSIWNFNLKKWDGFYEPIRKGEKWVEGASQERLNAIEQARIDAMLMPSPAEVAKAEREIETINLLSDLGVI